MPGRGIVGSSTYKYGFNGKENDKEVVGTGQGTQDYGLRIYNPSLGKFLSVDPLTKSYPMLTPYQFASDRPIDGVDMDGGEHISIHLKIENGRAHLVKTEIQVANANVLDDLISDQNEDGVLDYFAIVFVDYNGGSAAFQTHDPNKLDGIIKQAYAFIPPSPTKIEEENKKRKEEEDKMNMAVSFALLLDAFSNVENACEYNQCDDDISIILIPKETFNAEPTIEIKEPTPTVSTPVKRPYMRESTIKETWAQNKNEAGKVIDPTGVEITWDISKPRGKQWQMGHKYGMEYWRDWEEYKAGNISWDEMKARYNDPTRYRPELPSTNMGHKFEKK